MKGMNKRANHDEMACLAGHKVDLLPRISRVEECEISILVLPTGFVVSAASLLDFFRFESVRYLR